MLQVGRSRVRFPMVSLEFFIDIKSFRPNYGPGVDSASNRNEYQENFLGGEGGRSVKLTTDCLEILEPQPPATLWDRPDLNGITLPFYMDLNVQNSNVPHARV